MSRRTRIVVGLVLLVVGLNLASRFLGSITGGTPGGPRSSSYATGKTGLGAYAELLGRDGHVVDRVRERPRAAKLDPARTVVLLDPPAVAPADAVALHAFVESGGRLVAGGGGGGSWLDAMLANPPHGVARGLRDVRVLAGTGDLAAVRRVLTAGERSWSTAGSAQPLLGTRGHVVLARARLGSGTVLLLADPSPLQNRLLGSRDNAALGLALAGPRGRGVDFLETYHGYGTSTGLAAIPLSWQLMLLGLALAGLVYMVARGRRFGPPEAAARDLPPPRRLYVDALAAVLSRSGKRDEAVAPVRRRVRATVLRRAGLPADADDDAFGAAARRLGLPDDEAAAIVGTARTDADVLTVGRAMARIGQDLPG